MTRPLYAAVTAGLISSSFQMQVKVLRDETGNWRIFTDTENSGQFVLDAEGFDNQFMNTTHFGVFCKYTISNSTKFYFDDFYIGPPVVDTKPPELIELKATGFKSLELRFSELLDTNTVLIVDHYFVNKSIGTPTSVRLDSLDNRKVILNFEQAFENGETYEIQISGIADLEGNVVEMLTEQFSYYEALENDVVINEIFADPAPSVGLPESEFLELYNLQDFELDLSNWKLITGSSVKTFEDVSIPAKGYLILGHENATTEFSGYGNFHGFSSFSLTNKGQRLLLISDRGDTICLVNYDDTWYSNPEKKEGGWSLELINPMDYCSGKLNWTASSSEFGGTPGQQNSVHSDEIYPPKVERTELVADHILRVHFSQKMDESSLRDVLSFVVQPTFGNPDQIFTNSGDLMTAELYFNKHFEKSMVYSLEISEQLRNCMGTHFSGDTSIQFGLSEPPELNDIAINEILFNPLDGGEDYVELYNRSDKLIDLVQLQLGAIKESPTNPSDTAYYNVSEAQRLLFPGEYLLLSKDPDQVLERFDAAQRTSFWQMTSFPVYNNESGTCILRSIDDVIIDVFTYHEDMHHPLLQYVDGVSLERINYDLPAGDPKNWHSASEESDFGTPGYQNSQFQKSDLNLDADISIVPEVFSPDNDGYEDIQSVQYNFDTPGYALTIDIYSAEGYFITNLTDNYLVGTQGAVHWDGRQANNSVSPVGIYIYLISVFNTEGERKTYKRTGVLAGKL